MLAVTQFDGPANHPPCLIAHGLFGSARNWGYIAKKLSKTRPIIAVDMRNHGKSPHLPTNSYPDLAADLADVLAKQEQPWDVIGHSMGGKAAMVLALHYPDLVRKLIVADIAPVAYSHSQLPMINAMLTVDMSKIARRSDAAAALADQGLEPALQSFFTQSLDVAAQKWLFNLQVLADEMPKIMAFPDISGQFDKPTLFLTGAASDYVQPAHRPVIKKLFPKARFAKLNEAGHWLHADQPNAFLEAVDVFLSR